MDERVTKLSTMGSEITMRDRLIDLLKKADKNASMKCITDYEEAIADNADYLLEHGVIIPPCKVGEVEAVKEFAERLKARIFYTTLHPNGGLHLACINVKPEHIDNLVEEYEREKEKAK